MIEKAVAYMLYFDPVSDMVEVKLLFLYLMDGAQDALETKAVVEENIHSVIQRLRMHKMVPWTSFKLSAMRLVLDKYGIYILYNI